MNLTDEQRMDIARAVAKRTIMSVRDVETYRAIADAAYRAGVEDSAKEIEALWQRGSRASGWAGAIRALTKPAPEPPCPWCNDSGWEQAAGMFSKVRCGCVISPAPKPAPEQNSAGAACPKQPSTEGAGLSEGSPTAVPVGTDDGWLPWTGGECPVPPETIVNIQLRDWKKGKFANIKYRADTARWFHAQNNSDIIAYRIISPAPKLAPQPETTPVKDCKTCGRPLGTNFLLRVGDETAGAYHYGCDPQSASPAPKPARDWRREVVDAGMLAEVFLVDSRFGLSGYADGLRRAIERAARTKAAEDESETHPEKTHAWLEDAAE